MAKVTRWLRSNFGMGKKPYHCNVYFNSGNGNFYINLWRAVETGRKRETIQLGKDEAEDLYHKLSVFMEG